MMCLHPVIASSAANRGRAAVMAIGFSSAMAGATYTPLSQQRGRYGNTMEATSISLRFAKHEGLNMKYAKGWWANSGRKVKG